MKDLADQFGLGYQQCSNIIVGFRKSGIEGIRDESGKKVGTRRIITEKIGKFILESRDAEKTYPEISQMIRFRFKEKIKPASIMSWVYLQKKEVSTEPVKEALQVELPIEEMLPVVAQTQVTNPTDGVWQWNLYAGAMVLYAMIMKSGVLEVFEGLRDEKTQGTAWDVNRVVLTLFFLHLQDGDSSR